jgi:hypothetical protein
MDALIMYENTATAYNSVFAVRFAHPNAFSTSQTRKTLYDIAPQYNLDK